MITPVVRYVTRRRWNIRSWIRIIQLSRIVLIRISSSWQGFVGFLQVRQTPR